MALLFLAVPRQSWASSATAVTESQIEGMGDVQVYQSVETTVNGQTVKKESSQPGKLELKMEQTGEATSVSDVGSATPSPTTEVEENPQEESEPQSVFERIVNFFKGFVDKILGIF